MWDLLFVLAAPALVIWVLFVLVVLSIAVYFAGYAAGAVVGLFNGTSRESGWLGGAIAVAGFLLYLFTGGSGVEERADDERIERVERCKPRVAAWRANGRRGDPPVCQGGYLVPATKAEGRDHARRMRRIRHLRNVR